MHNIMDMCTLQHRVDRHLKTTQEIRLSILRPFPDRPNKAYKPVTTSQLRRLAWVSSMVGLNSRSSQYLLIAVVVELVVAGKCNEAAPSWTQREKYLHCGLHPYLV